MAQTYFVEAKHERSEVRTLIFRRLVSLAGAHKTAVDQP